MTDAFAPPPSWLEPANRRESDFPLANLPYGAYAASGGGQNLCCAIGDQILDLRAGLEAGLWAALPEAAQTACSSPTLNLLMALDAPVLADLRARCQYLLGLSAPADARAALARCLVPLADARLRLAVCIGDYTDFYASLDHARNVGSLFRPDNPLLPNYKYIPVGYHGRSSSVNVGPAQVRRPCGQRPPGAGAEAPDFGPSRALDYEAEIGFFVGAGNAQGDPIPLARAERHLFGLCLLNDWSARDLQRWEYQPLGPFLAKNFATTLSPWIVTLPALQPFRVPPPARPAGDPAPLPYLRDERDQQAGGLDLQIEVYLTSTAMREQHLEPLRLSRGNLRDLYWTMGQMLTHHASNGCNLRPGDLLGSGTISGAEPSARGCLLELTAGTDGLALPTGESRKFLADGDEVTLRAYCERPGLRLGWGECRGRVTPALMP